MDESLISPWQLKMMSPWKQIVLLSITGCLAGKILEYILYLSPDVFVVMVYVATTFFSYEYVPFNAFQYKNECCCQSLCQAVLHKANACL